MDCAGVLTSLVLVHLDYLELDTCSTAAGRRHIEAGVHRVERTPEYVGSGGNPEVSIS